MLDYYERSFFGVYSKRLLVVASVVTVTSQFYLIFTSALAGHPIFFLFFIPVAAFLCLPYAIMAWMRRRVPKELRRVWMVGITLVAIPGILAALTFLLIAQLGVVACQFACLAYIWGRIILWRRMHGGVNDGGTYEIRESTKYSFGRFMSEIVSYPYEAQNERRQTIMDNVSKLTLGMTKEQVQDLIGSPDYEWLNYSKADGMKYAGADDAYCLHIEESQEANEQRGVEAVLYFDADDVLYWVLPRNMSNAQEIGGPRLAGKTKKLAISS
ncbi:MAG: outer membrane protein assembly factor BamE [Candidatus Hydrogenedentes bacterium]|nr:outer membrane protein assembly factor BamE [Candidatus Hydrogenedentota bacterium]